MIWGLGVGRQRWRGLRCGRGIRSTFLVQYSLYVVNYWNLVTYPFARGQSRTVDDELLGLWHPSSLAFDASNITPMAKLRPLVHVISEKNITKQHEFNSLRITSNHLPIIHLRQPIRTLFIITLFLDRSNEHLDMHHIRAHIIAEIHSHLMIFFAPVVLIHQPLKILTSCESQVISLRRR